MLQKPKNGLCPFVDKVLYSGEAYVAAEGNGKGDITKSQRIYQ